MRIEPGRPVPAPAVRSTGDGGSGRATPANAAPAPSVDLSAATELLLLAQEALAASADRSERVAALKQQLASGTYQVDLPSLAEKLL